MTREEKHRECQKKYHKTEAGKATQRRYRKSDKGRVVTAKSPSSKRRWVDYVLYGLGPRDY